MERILCARYNHIRSFRQAVNDRDRSQSAPRVHIPKLYESDPSK